MSNPSNKSIELVQALLYDVNNVKYDITKITTAFFYYEDIFSPFVTAVINVHDSGQNLIGNLPIQGGEKIIIKIGDVRNNVIEYEMYVWKIYNRQFTKNSQNYNLALISKEALYNEGVRITEPLSGLPNKIVQKILKEYLMTDKSIDAEVAKYNIKFYPNGKKAHAIIQSLMYKSVSKNSSPSSGSTTSTPSGEVKTSIPTDTKKASGTAGYLFFENKDGFVFKSMDLLCSDGSDSFGGQAPVATYIYKPIKDPTSAENFYVIEEYRFNNEIDMIDQLRNGIFSTYMVFYNYSTGTYEEYTYSLSETFKNMSHLGSQDKLPAFQEKMSSYPSRVMSMVLDHETWFDGTESASPEAIDGGTAKSQFPDYQKYYISQGIARRYLMENQKMEITIPGNTDLKVGDKIKILIPNVSAEQERQTKPYDEESSGTYLISKLSHNNVFLNSSTCTTKLELIRDTYGIKEYSSKVK